MKIINKLSNGEFEVEAECAKEALYEVGEWVEIDYTDYQIIKKDGKRYLVK